MLKLLAAAATSPNAAVKNKVALNAVVRPIKSEPGHTMSTTLEDVNLTHMRPSQPRRPSCPRTCRSKAHQ